MLQCEYKPSETIFNVLFFLFDVKIQLQVLCLYLSVSSLLVRRSIMYSNTLSTRKVASMYHSVVHALILKNFKHVEFKLYDHNVLLLKCYDQTVLFGTARMIRLTILFGIPMFTLKKNLVNKQISFFLIQTEISNGILYANCRFQIFSNQIERSSIFQ